MTISEAAPRQTFQALQAALRPPRAVVLYDGADHWLSNAAFFLHTCQGIWGGSGFLLIPHDNGHVSRPLRRLARAYDPDYVVNLPMTVAQFEAIYPGAYQVNGPDGKPLKGAERTAALEYFRDRMVKDTTGYQARALVAADCTPHRNWLPDNNGDTGSHDEQTQVLDTRDHGAFTSIERFGASNLSDAGVPSNLAGPWALAAAMHVGFAEAPLLPFEQDTPAEEAAMRRLINEAARAPSYVRYSSLLESPWNSAWQPSETGLARVGTGQGALQPHLVVIGATAADFALAQGWQLLFGKAHWIPEAHLPLEGTAEYVTSTLGQELIDDPEYRHLGAVLTSASVPLAQLQQLAQEWDDDARSLMMIKNSVGAEAIEEGQPIAEPGLQLKCTLPEKIPWDHGGMFVIAEDYNVPLALPAQESDQGDIRLLVNLPPITPSDPALRKAAGLTWQTDLHFPDAATPHTRRLSPRALQSDDERSLESFVRRSRYGVTCFSESWGFISAAAPKIQNLAKPRLNLPGLYSWAQTHAEDNNMEVKFSAAGRRVEILRRMWGTRAALASDWAGPLRPMFLAFRTKAKTTSTAFPYSGGLVLAPPETVLSFTGMMAALRADTEIQIKTLRSDIDRLCLHGVMRRGLVLDCETCGQVNFTPVETVSNVNSCVRCGAPNPLAADRWRHPIAEPTWWYDLHPAARELLAEDSGIALLCSAHLRKSARSYADLSELEFFPHDQHPVAEIDLLAHCGDKVIIGEAKTNPTLGTRKERESKASKLALVARMLHADEILLCTSATDNWPQIDVKALKDTIASKFADAPAEPMIRVITGLGTTDVNDEGADPTGPTA